ncbi:HK97-gp10 family putative phage morphogenesis protein [Anatilimnocola floriformis]|uniref:HK97-gp10 family putative phage morphogenesis protein n=1 Tax=Anatilimnocola floriformis TaxID=2948575 RepID=UPI0020C230C0|nr:HK97-gp10 family putative phage morphogenesis protein [Anatilimnocola floriformis]
MTKPQTIKVEGLPQLIKALGEFEKKIFNKVLKKAFREGAKVSQKAIKALIPKGETGALRKALKVRTLARKKDRVGISVQMGEGSFQGATFYGGFLEWGTKNKEGQTKIEAREFIKKGFNDSKEAAAAAMVRTIKEGINAAAKEAARESGATAA